MGQEASLWTNLFDIITMDLESMELTRDSAEVVWRMGEDICLRCSRWFKMLYLEHFDIHKVRITILVWRWVYNIAVISAVSELGLVFLC